MNNETAKFFRFSEIDFIRLYCAMNFKKGISPIIKHHELEKKLYRFHSLPEFRELFQDICPKKDTINPENSYLDLGNALQTAQLFGLLTPIHGAGEIRSIVSCDDSIAEKIISNTDTKIVDKMSNLFDAMFSLDNDSNKKESTQITDAESVMNNFMKKLDSGDFTRDKEQSIGEELALDEEFIADQMESYSKLLKSPIMQEVQGLKLEKRNTLK